MLVHVVIIKLSITSEENDKLQTLKFDKVFEFQCVIRNSPKPRTLHKDVIAFQITLQFLVALKDKRLFS